LQPHRHDDALSEGEDLADDDISAARLVRRVDPFILALFRGLALPRLDLGASQTHQRLLRLRHGGRGVRSGVWTLSLVFMGNSTDADSAVAARRCTMSILDDAATERG
jgi:hypothetical protein